MTLQSEINKAILQNDEMALRKSLKEIMKTFKNQKEMFDHIYEERGPFSELSGKPLLPKGHFKFYWQFLHVLGKGPYPAYKLNPNNILLGLPEEHEKQETYEVFKEKHAELKRQYYKEVYGKEF